MTTPGSGGNINLAALWVPVMPETSHMGEEMKKAGSQAKRQFEEGFNSGTSPEQIGSNFSSKVTKAMTEGFKGLEIPFGGSSFLEKFSRDVDEKLVNKLKGQASQALQQYRQEWEKLAEVQGRAAEAQNKLTVAQEGGFNKANIMLPLMSQNTRAQKELEEQTTKTTAAHENLTGVTGKLKDAEGEAVKVSGVMAGIMGGALVLGVQSAMNGIESLAEKMIEGVVETFKMGIEVTKELADKAIELGETYEHIGIQIHEFSDTSGSAFEELEGHARKVFGTLDVAGADTGKTMAQFASILDAEPGPALDMLTQHVEELQGRFTNLRAADLGSIFFAFKTPVEQTDSALASLLQSARGAGQGLGDMASALQGNVALTLSEAGMSIQQAGAFMADMMKMGDPGRQAMGGLATAMKEFGKEGLSFGEGMKLAGDRLKELGDTAEGQKLAESLFGTRNWIVAKNAVQDYLEVVEKGPDAFNANADSVDQFLEQTRTLSNEWELVKHKVEEAFMPIGLEAVQMVSGAIDSIKEYIDGHMPQIRDAIKGLGLGLIAFASDAEKFAAGVLDFFGPLADVIAQFVGGTIALMGDFAHYAGDIISNIPGMEDVGNGLIDAGKSAENFGKNLYNLQVSDKMHDLSQWIKQHQIDVQGASDDWIHFSDSVGTAMDSANNSVGGFMDKFPSPSGVFGAGAGLGGPTGPLFGPGGPGSLGAPGGSNGPLFGSGASGGQHKADWDAIAAKEGGGQWNITYTTGVPNGGGLQIKPTTWAMYGGNELTGTALPYKATKEQQETIAERILNGWNNIPGQGPGAWPDTYVGYEGGGHVLSGSGQRDDVPALLKRGEYVWDTEDVDKYGWLIKGIHDGGIRGFDQGGGLDTAGAQVDTIAVAKAAQSLFGINDIGMFRSADGYNEHASGEAADVMTGNNKPLGDQVARYFLQHAAQYGVQYVLWQQQQWNPDGTHSAMTDRGGPTANHLDHVHIRTLGGGFPHGVKPEGFAPPRSGQTSPTPAVIPGMMQAFGQAGGGGGSLQFPGLEGQYGGYGAYGGETADQQYSLAKSVQDARDRAADLDYSVSQALKHIDEIKAKLAEADKPELGLLGQPIVKTPAQQDADVQKKKSLNSELDNATHALAVAQRERAEQDGNISQAERKQAEGQYKKPSGTGGSKGKDDSGLWSSLGSGLLSGMAQELGFGDIFKKAPWEWGAVKLLTGLAGWGLGEANAWGDAIYGKSDGSGGMSPGGAGLGGLSSALGINIPKTMLSAGPNVQPGQGVPMGDMGNVMGRPPGPVTYDNSLHISSDIDPNHVASIVNDGKGAQNSSLNTYTGGLPPP